MFKVGTYFGLWLAVAYSDLGLTIREFAKEIGLYYGTIINHIRGTSQVSIAVVKKYADFFGVNWVILYDLYLLGEIDNTDMEKRKERDGIIEMLESCRKTS